MKSNYRDWLEQQQYALGTVQAQVNRAGRFEKHYGDLDEHYDRDGLQSVIDELKYTAEDERRNLPNPSKIPFNGDIRTNLASYRNAAERYCRFRRDSSVQTVEFLVECIPWHRLKPPKIDEPADKPTLHRITPRQPMETIGVIVGPEFLLSALASTQLFEQVGFRHHLRHHHDIGIRFRQPASASKQFNKIQLV